MLNFQEESFKNLSLCKTTLMAGILLEWAPASDIILVRSEVHHMKENIKFYCSNIVFINSLKSIGKLYVQLFLL
jgi:hypothetical protein